MLLTSKFGWLVIISLPPFFKWEGGEFQIISCSFRSFYIQFLEDDMTKPITPLIAADIIIELIDIPSRPIVLI